MNKAFIAYVKALIRGQIIAPAEAFPFVTKGFLVFDIGANIGNYTARFLKMGAKVIALEPQPYCKNYLKMRFLFNSNVTVVAKGVSDRSGPTELLLTDSHTIASVDKEWIDGVSESGRFDLQTKDWNRKVTIDLTTLDQLIKQYGKPGLIKIDVEGHEDKVLKGLSIAVDYVTFEYTLPEHTASCLRCIEHLASIGNYEFESISESGKWFRAPEFAAEVKQQASLGQLLNGDILARRT